MKEIFTLLSSMLILSLMAQPPGDIQDWDLVFEDEFNGNTLDQSKWGYNYPSFFPNGGHTHNHRAYMVEDQVSVENGSLAITAIDQRHPDAPDGTSQWADQFGYLSFDYTAGAVTTYDKFDFTYGYVEGRFKASGTGTWPAFWTLNSDGGWPPEIDILEIPHSRNIHHFYYHYGEWPNNRSFGATHTGVDKSEGFHVYAVDWGPDYMNFYFDNELVQSYTNRAQASEGENMYLLINLAVGGWSGDPSSSDVFPTKYYCDYVRVWQKKPFQNFDFETGTLPPWTSWNTASVTSGCSRMGNYGVTLSGSLASVEQVVVVEPNTTYVFEGYGKVNSAGEAVVLGVKNHGGNQVTSTITSTNFTKANVTFTTGPSDNQATVFFYKHEGIGTACGDDFALFKEPDCNGDRGGTAYLDNCDVCVEGATGKLPCSSIQNGYYKIRPMHSQKCLGLASNEYLQQESCATAVGQYWYLDRRGSWNSLTSYQHDYALAYESATNGATLSAQSLFNDTDEQLFRIETVGNGTYHVIPKLDLSKSLDISGGSTNEGAQAILWDRNGMDNQIFEIQPTTILFDCNNDWQGSALRDSCGICAGGNTGIIPVLDVDQCIITGEVGSHESIVIRVSPNPFSNQFRVECDFEVVVTVYNTTGQVVLSQQMAGDQLIGSELSEGMYSLIISLPSGEALTKQRLIKF